jgi:hypothetical protein
MVDFTNPSTISVTVLIISFMLFAGLLNTYRPVWVQSNNTGDNEISYELVLSYSLSFSLVVSITTLLIYAKR